MLKVIDTFLIGTTLSVTLEGRCDNISNGSRLVDSNGNIIVVKSVAMTRHDNPADISKNTTILIDYCDIKKGSELSIVA